MSAFVEQAAIGAAYDRAAQRWLAPEDEQRWRQVLEYAAANPADSTPARAAELRELVGGRSDADVLARAAAVLAGELAGPGDDAERAAAVHERCRHWFADDVAAAAPLLEVFTGHHGDPAAEPAPPDPALVSSLQDWLARRAGPDTVVERAAVLSGGFSRLMLDVRWRGEAGPQRGVVRIEQDGMFATEGRREAAVMRIVEAAGYPVPHILWEEPDPAVLGHPFFVMEHVDGAARTDDEGLHDMLRAVADLHGLDRGPVDSVAALDGIPAGSSPETVIAAQLDHWHGVYRTAVGAPIPLLERAFAWLGQHLHPTGQSVIVHGDPGPGNALQNATGIAAVIDWEFAHAGDAGEDWAYLALIRGRKLGPPAEWKARLRDTVGVSFSEPQWRAWEAFNQVKGACVNLTALDVFRRSARPTPDLLAIGVAVHLRFLARALELTDQ